MPLIFVFMSVLKLLSNADRVIFIISGLQESKYMYIAQEDPRRACDIMKNIK